MFKGEFSFEIPVGKKYFQMILKNLAKCELILLMLILSCVSVYAFYFYYQNGLGLAYNDARSHLDISRRVVEGLKPGLAQLGSVWLPLPHITMLPFVWNDFLWHSGLAGALVSMVGYVSTGVLIWLFLKQIRVKLLGRIVAVVLFAFNLNILYLQSTAMTELLLIATTMATIYYLLLWTKTNLIINLIKAGFWVMMSTLARYDGWFLLVMTSGLIGLNTFIGKSLFDFKDIFHNLYGKFRKAEGLIFLFGTLGGLGIILWFLWNLLIFGDPLYFAFGPYSAHAQQQVLDQAGDLVTKNNIPEAVKTYFYAFVYNSNAFMVILTMVASIVFWLDKKVPIRERLVASALYAPLIFNIIALYMGHSVLFIQGLNGDTWFNIRYGIMLMPTVAIFLGYLVDRVSNLRGVLLGLLGVAMFFTFMSYDAVTIDDARVGSSQKNVSEVSGYLKEYAKNEKGFILVSAASHDAIIFSSGLPMGRFIHEGTGAYWDSATTAPDRWARWIVARTYDDNDSTWRLIKETDGLAKYRLVAKYPFADIYQLKDEYLGELNTEPIFKNQK